MLSLFLHQIYLLIFHILHILIKQIRVSIRKKGNYETNESIPIMFISELKSNEDLKFHLYIHFTRRRIH